MMDVLIVERDELMGSILADAMDGEGIPFVVASDEEAMKLPPDDAPRVVITGLNRGHYEDLTGLELVADMRRKWPQLCVVYLASLWPVHPRRELAAGERFLTKPVRLTQVTDAVRELLGSGLCESAGIAPMAYHRFRISGSSPSPSARRQVSTRSPGCCQSRTVFRFYRVKRVTDGRSARSQNSSLRAAPVPANSNDTPPRRPRSKAR